MKNMIIVANDHLTADAIEMYSMGTLSPEDCDCADDHLLICESCQVALEEMDDFLLHMREAVQRAASQQEPESLWSCIMDGLRSFSIQPLPAAAALCVAAALIVVVPSFKSPTDEPPQHLSLDSMRGDSTPIVAIANRRIELNLNLDGLAASPNYRVTIVDYIGRAVFNGTAEMKGTQLHLEAPSLKPGAHFIRIYNPASQLLREFLLEVK